MAEQIKLGENNQFERHPPEKKEECYGLFKKGKKLTEIAEMTKIPLPTIRRWSMRGKWKARQIASIPAPGKRMEVDGSSIVDNSSPETVARAAVMTLAEQQEDYKTRMAAQALRLPVMLEHMSDEDVIRNADKISKLDATARKGLHLEENKPSIVVNVGLLAAALPARPAHVLDDVNIAGELPAPSPEVTDAEFTAIEDAVPEPVAEKVAAQ